MYFYKIARVGFGFRTDAKLLENNFFGKFSVSEEEFDALSDKHIYTFENKIYDLSEYTMFFSGESTRFYDTGDTLIKETGRSDGCEYGYLCEYRDTEPGGNISFYGHNGENLKTTAELFRIIDFISGLMFFDAFILHASCVKTCDGVILFSGKSGCGKSTQAALWNKYRSAEILNGDRVIIRKIDNKLFACGVPFCGSSSACELFVLPVKAVVFLGKAGKNNPSEMSAIQTLLTLSGQITCGVRKGLDTDRLISLTDRFCRDIRIVKFDCLPDASAVDCLEEYLAVY